MRTLLDWSRSLFGSPNFQGFAKLATGSTAAQLVLIAASPVLTRLYSPDDLGVLAAFLALSSMLIVVAAGRYEWAIMMTKDDEEATEIAALSLLLTGATSLLSLAGVAVAYPWLVGSGDWAMGAWLFLVPVTVLVGGASSVFVADATRRGHFGLLGATQVVRQLVGVTVQVVLGVLRFTPGGLLVGGFLSIGAANARLGGPVVRRIRQQRPSRYDLWAAARRYSRFPRYTLPATVLSGAYLQGTPLIVGGMYGAAALGLWTLTQRVLSLPAAVIGASAAESYYRAATAARADGRVALRLYDRTVLGLAAVALVPLTVVALWGPQLFAWVFGPEWAQAGVYARLMVPLIWMRFVASPISRTFIVYERNSLGMWVQAALLLVLAGVALTAVLLDLPFEAFLTWYSVASALVYAGLIAWSRLIVVRAGYPATESPPGA